jgi:hypothetical protein
MLTRPAQSSHVASPAERLQLATLFGMLGTFLGILAVALALWLFQLQGRMQEQNENIMTLARAVEQLGDNQRLATDTLLRKVATDKPEEFLAQYNKASRDRDEAGRLLAVQRSMTEAEGARAKALADKLQTVEKDLAQFKADAKEVPDLRKRVVGLEESNDIKQRQLDDLEPFIKKTKEGGVDVDALLREVGRSRFFAYAGWSISALLAAGLIATFFFYKPPLPSDEPAPGMPDEDPDRPTHRIV